MNLLFFIFLRPLTENVEIVTVDCKYIMLITFWPFCKIIMIILVIILLLLLLLLYKFMIIIL